MKRLGAAGLAWFVVLLGRLPAQPAFAQDTARTGKLLVEVPEDAKVEINGSVTRAVGPLREFFARGLEPGFAYDYVVRAQVVREGRTLEQVQKTRLQAGQTVRVVFLPAGWEVKRDEPTPAPKPKEAAPGWQPKEPMPAPTAKETAPGSKTKDPTPGSQSKGPSSTQAQVPLPPVGPENSLGPPPKGPQGTKPGTPSESAKKQAGPTSPPLEGPGTKSSEKKLPAPKPGEKKPDAKTPEKNGADLTGPQKPSKPGLPGPTAPIVRKKPTVEEDPLVGELARGGERMAKRLTANPRDEEARFGLGTVQFLRAVERLGQAMYRYGFRNPPPGIEALNLPLGRLPVPRNPKPQPLTYLRAHEILEEFLSDLTQAEATLAQIRDEQVKLPIHVGLMRLDLTGDGKSTVELWQAYAKLSGRPNLRQSDARALLICFDYGDVLWLRGYCHLLMAIDEMVLAYDERDLFERAGNLLFANPVSSQQFLVKDPEQLTGRLDNALVVALKHLVNFKLEAPERMAKAMKHLRAMLDLSRQSWKAILAETDDDFEWIPNPNQRGAIPNLAVTRAIVDAWLRSVDEADAILAGTKLAPPLAAGQSGDDYGVDVSQIFTKPPTTFDLILWIQGSGVAPFLKKGTLSDPKVWRRLQDVFGDDFLNYALWFN